MEDLHLYFRIGQLAECVGQRFGWTALIGLDDQAQLPLLSRRRMRHEIFQRHDATGCAATLRFAIEPLASLRDLTGRRRVFHDEQLIARHRNARQSEDLHRNGRTGFLHRLATLVQQRPHAPGIYAADVVVTDSERTVLHQHRRNGTLALIELRFDDRADGTPRRIGLQFKDVRLQEDLIKQFADTGTLFGGDFGVQHRAAEIFEYDIVLKQVLFDLGDVGHWQIDLVDRNDDGHSRALRVGDRFDGLRHDLVVGRDHDDDNVRYLRATRPHGRKRFVTGCIKEGDLAVVAHLHVIRADVLGDAARFACDDIGFAHIVEQRRLAVIDVAHDSDNRRTRPQILGRIDLHVFEEVRRVVAFLDRLKTKLARDQLNLIEIETLIDGDHQEQRLECESDDLCGRDA